MRAAVVVISGLPPRDYEVVDMAHATGKGDATADGLMPAGSTPSALPRPPATRRPWSTRPPYPTVAVRDMAFHDIHYEARQRASNRDVASHATRPRLVWPTGRRLDNANG